MSGYVYRGNKHDVEPVVETAPSLGPDVFDPSKCGQYRGYHQHQKFGQEPCRACKDAKAVKSKAEYAARKIKRLGAAAAVTRADRPTRPAGRPSCGTGAGYAAHIYRGEPSCAPCRAAEATRKRKASRASGAVKSVRIPLDSTCNHCGHHIFEGEAA